MIKCTLSYGFRRKSLPYIELVTHKMILWNKKWLMQSILDNPDLPRKKRKFDHIRKRLSSQSKHKTDQQMIQQRAF